MTQITKQAFSAQPTGAPILVAATADPGTLIHTAQSGETGFDEIWLFAYNTSGSAVNLTIEFGGNATQNLLTVSIPAAGSVKTQIIPGEILCNGLTVRAYASVTNVIAISGFVNSIA